MAPQVPARFWEPAGREGQLRCGLCHHRCVIAPGAKGACGVRRNDGGTLVLPYYGRISSASVDPMEKKPLYHFMPGSSVYSVGYLGCNLHCPYCQNFGISQSTTAPSRYLSPRDLVDAAASSGAPSLAHTYSEPLVHAEYVIESMKLARAAGLKNVLVTNGCALEQPAGEILRLCDAVNVDIKAWNGDWYRAELGGDLPTVLAFVRLAYELGVHVEATTLVIPGRNDADDDIAGISAFLASLSPDIPLHLSAYRPMYRYTVRPTPESTITRLERIARQSLRYVYAGNLWSERNDTLCPHCGAVLVSRSGYRVDARGLSGNACARCGRPAPIRT